MNNKVKLLTLIVMSTILGAYPVIAVSEGYQFLANDLSHLFTIDNAGNINVTNYALVGSADGGGLSAGDINISGTYYGDGSGLTGVTVSLEANSITISGANITGGLDYHNITGLPTCSVGQFYTFDGTDFTCGNLVANTITISGANITGGLDYHNITSIPTCGAGESLTFDGTDLSCASAGMNYTNVALTNQTNSFSELQTFSAGIDLADNITIDNNYGIVWDASGAAVWADASGTFKFKLGA